MNEPFNKLTPGQLERLTKLSEECSEVIKTICKIVLHGYESTDPTFQVEGTNREQLEKEIGDINAAVNLLAVRNEVFYAAILDHQDAKIQKYLDGKCYLHHQ